jgi:hypothetical protein
MLHSAVENAAILLLLICSILYRDKKMIYDYNLLLFMCLSVVLYFSIIGIMTPVLGNLVRYKVVLMPLLLFVLFYILDAKRLPFQDTNHR